MEAWRQASKADILDCEAGRVSRCERRRGSGCLWATGFRCARREIETLGSRTGGLHVGRPGLLFDLDHWRQCAAMSVGRKWSARFRSHGVESELTRWARSCRKLGCARLNYCASRRSAKHYSSPASRQTRRQRWRARGTKWAQGRSGAARDGERRRGRRSRWAAVLLWRWSYCRRIGSADWLSLTGPRGGNRRRWQCCYCARRSSARETSRLLLAAVEALANR